MKSLLGMVYIQNTRVLTYDDLRSLGILTQTYENLYLEGCTGINGLCYPVAPANTIDYLVGQGISVAWFWTVRLDASVLRAEPEGKVFVSQHSTVSTGILRESLLRVYNGCTSMYVYASHAEMVVPIEITAKVSVSMYHPVGEVVPEINPLLVVMGLTASAPVKQASQGYDSFLGGNSCQSSHQFIPPSPQPTPQPQPQTAPSTTHKAVEKPSAVDVVKSMFPLF